MKRAYIYPSMQAIGLLNADELLYVTSIPEGAPDPGDLPINTPKMNQDFDEWDDEEGYDPHYFRNSW